MKNKKITPVKIYHTFDKKSNFIEINKGEYDDALLIVNKSYPVDFAGLKVFYERSLLY
jgi:hypothetical protein